jgi:2-dehydropantoate 2-reductase
VIKHNNWTRTTIGPYFPPDPSRPEAAAYATTRTTEFADLLVKAGIEDVDTLSHMDMQFARWHKTAINAAMNPTNVLAGGPTNQAMALDEEMYKHMAGVMSEILDAAVKILGGPIPDFLPKVEQVLGGVKIDDSGGRPSMWGDWENSRKVELEAILGAPLRRARNAGIELPRTQSLYALLKKAQQMRYALR